MKVVALSQVEAVAMQMDGVRGVMKQLPLGRADGVPNFSFRVFTLEPGGHTPYHTHPPEHLNYIIAGEGAVVNAAGELQPLRTGDFVFIPPQEKHQYRNTGTAPLVMICAVPSQYE